MTNRNMLDERDLLTKQIQEWNANRLDLFALTIPDENLEYFGVMRFFYQDDTSGGKVATKCVRVSSTATVATVLEILIEKFRPDMRMLSMNKYCLYEVHADGEERRLGDDEYPLQSQLSWGRDDREGRFLLKREDAKTAFMEDFHDKGVQPQPFKRKLSKREKKEKKKKEKEARAKGKENAAEQLYNELPETSFTRTVSNPEMVMRRRRQQKLEKKLQQFRSRDGGPDSGGTLKIYGETLQRDVPYKTLLLSTNDTVAQVLKETLEKYRLEKEDPNDYCLFKVHLVPAKDGSGRLEYGDEEILDDDECPLAIHIQYPPSQGSVMFQIRRRPADYEKRKRARKQRPNDMDYRQQGNYPQPNAGWSPANIPPEKLPYIMNLHPDGREPYNPVRHRLKSEMLEVGSASTMQATSGEHLQLFGAYVQPRHCIIAHSKGIVTITPTSRDAETYVDNQRIFETTTLMNGMTFRFGKSHLFRFCDPMAEEKQLKRQHSNELSNRPQGPYDNRRPNSGSMETSFDVDGHVETMSGQQPKRPDDFPHGPGPQNGIRGPPQMKLEEDLLPAGLEFREDGEDTFLASLISDSSVPTAVFKLAPTYALYMASRYRVSRHYRPEMSASERAHRLTSLVNKISSMTQQTIQEEHDNANALAFWMANSSELLHFFKQDRNIGPYSGDAQNVLAEAVRVAFHELVYCLQNDLHQAMPAFLDDNDEDADEDWNMDDQIDMHGRYQRNRPIMSDVIHSMSSAMSLLRRCRVNAALTIQLFSQLFHYINMWLFNKIVMELRLRLCTRQWGFRLKRRLARIEVWAEKQGLELAADCHLARIIQTAHLLQSQKHSAEDFTNITSSCFKLNSLQLRVLLQSYLPDRDEPHVPRDLINRLVSMAEKTADEIIQSEDREVRLEEDQDLHLPFLLPEDGYSCDIVRGIPNGLVDFLDPPMSAGICNLVVHHQAPGPWTVYMDTDMPENMPMHPSPGGPRNEAPASPEPQEPEVIQVAFRKVNGSMGLSIVAAKGEGQKERGIYIKSVVAGGAAALDGRLQAGDQLLEVDEKSLVGLTQEKAAELMTRTGAVVDLKVAKQAAIYHGLATLLSQPSPIMQRAGQRPPQGAPRPKSEDVSRFNGPRDDSMMQPPDRGYPPYQQRSLQEQHGPQSKSTPSLANDMPPSDREHYNTYDPQQQFNNPPYQQAPGFREPQVRSKSTSNLKQEPEVEESRRRQLVSTGTFPHDPAQRDMGRSQPNLIGPDERNGPFARETRPNYENYGPNFKGDPNAHERGPQQGHPFGSTPHLSDKNENMTGTFRKPEAQRPDGRGPRHHSERPISAYVPQDERPEFGAMRPKSEHIDQDKLNDWKQKYDLDDHRSRPEQNSSFQSSPNMNYRQEPSHGRFRPKEEPDARSEKSVAGDLKAQLALQGFTALPSNDKNGSRISLSSKGSSDDIPKVQRPQSQLHFFQNAPIRQRETTPPFEQLKKQELDRPPVAPKPKFAPKPQEGPKIQPPPEIPRANNDNRKTQPNFFYNSEPVAVNNAYGFNPQMAQPEVKTAVKVQFDQKRGRPDSPELPPPPPALNLANEDLDADEMPPPPPPPQDYIPYGQPGRGDSVNRGQKPYNQNREHLPPDQNRWSQKQEPPKTSPTYPPYSQSSMPYSAQPDIQPQTSQPRQPYDQQNPRQPQFTQNRPIENQQKWQPPKSKLRVALPPGQERAESPNVSPSPWDREQREREQKRQEQEMSMLRDREIQELEAKPYLTQEEQERLTRLRLDQEFQRRLAEVKDDDEDQDSDDGRERAAGHKRIAQQIFNDLERTQALRKQKEALEREEDRQKDLDAKQRQERMLEMYEKERDIQRQRQARKQERQGREHEEWLRKQRELREKQQAEEEERKRMVQLEEERLKNKREEEMRKKREQEKEQLREMHIAREAEERAQREENMRRNDEYMRQRPPQDPRYYDDNRNERFGKPQHPYGPPQQQPAGPPNPRINHYGTDNRVDGPPPPQRGSSFNMMNQVRHNRGSDSSQEQIPPYSSSSPLRPQDVAAQKKSVSFDAKLTTEIAPQYNHDGSQPSNLQSHGHYPPTSKAQQPQQSYQTGNQSSYNPNGPSIPYSQDQMYEPNHTTPQGGQQNPVSYQVSSTPGVIGAQEVYRDPRDRRLEGHNQMAGKAPGEKLSFRDKMKLFAETAGENTPKERPKSSRSQRLLEMNLSP